MGCCGSRKVGNYEALKTVEMNNQSLGRFGKWHQNEKKFFCIFFSAMDNKPGFQGILRRWQRADQETEHMVNWHEVWQKPFGYIETLERIQSLVNDKQLQSTLRQWSKLVVRQRKKNYTLAQERGTADPGHRMALETWQKLDRALQGWG